MIKTLKLMLLFMLALISSIAVFAQDGTVSDNAVNAVAEKMYCPVCENIPLDDCQTATCIEWKEEIRIQLSEGESEQAIIDSFIVRFGDHVVGTPQDPILRAMTIIIPILAVIGAIFVGIFTFRRFGQHQKLKLDNETLASPGTLSDDDYRKRLEADLVARR